MNSKKNAEIEFDTWAELAQNDPEGFEALRQKAIAEVIDSAPAENRQRLRCLQWRIDQERKLAKTPMNACIRISRMMWRNVLGPGGLQDRFVELQGLFSGKPMAPRFGEAPEPARVVNFGRARD